MDQLHVDFRTHSRTLSDDRGVFYEATNRAIIILQNHECLEYIFATIEHESIHFCLREDEDIDEEQEEQITFRMAWACESL